MASPLDAYIPRDPDFSTGEDWVFVLKDLRDDTLEPIDLTGKSLSLQFRPASLRGILIQELDDDQGIEVSAGEEGDGPTVTITSRAVDRPTFSPLIDTPVIGDLMAYSGTGSNRTSTRLRRIQFTALWAATQDTP